MELAVNVHGVALVTLVAQQQLAPVILDMGQVHGEVDVCDIHEHGRQLRICQNPLVEELNKGRDVFAVAQVGLSGRAFRGQRQAGMPDAAARAA